MFLPGVLLVILNIWMFAMARSSAQKRFIVIQQERGA